MKPTLIPERLIKARESLKLNKSQAAELLGLSPIGYLRYEQGLRTPSPQMLNIIALTFNTSVDFLTGKTKNSAANQILLNKAFQPRKLNNPNVYWPIIKNFAKSNDFISFLSITPQALPVAR